MTSKIYQIIIPTSNSTSQEQLDGALPREAKNKLMLSGLESHVADGFTLVGQRGSTRAFGCLGHRAGGSVNGSTTGKVLKVLHGSKPPEHIENI